MNGHEDEQNLAWCISCLMLYELKGSLYRFDLIKIVPFIYLSFKNEKKLSTLTQFLDILLHMNPVARNV